MTLFLGLFLISLSSAFSINEDIPTNVKLKCGESYNEEFIINPEDSENITIIPGVISNDNMNLALTLHPSTNHLYISLFQNGDCVVNNKEFSFSINNEEYKIGVNITEDLWGLENITMKEGEKITVGGIAEFSLLTAGSDNIMFMIEGCDEEVDDFLDVGNFKDVVCNDEVVRFEVIDSYIDLEASRILVSSSESGWNIVKGESTIEEDGCDLGLDTLGAMVKRGNVFAINTLNTKNNKKVKDVSVTILDQTGELSAINGLSSNTGFFSERLHEEYSEDLIVQLEKEGCEPNTQIILFQNTYNDYIDNKNKEKNSKTLNFTIGTNYKSGENFLSKVENLLGEEIEDAEVKITSPNDINLIVKSDFDGSFNFTLNEAGIWKIQIGKTDYISSDLIEFEVISSEFIIVSLVDNEIKNEFKEGDEIIFEIRDENNSIVHRNVVAMFGDEEIDFLDGISEEVVFKERTDLIIPSGDGYEEYEITLKVKKSNINIWYLLGGFVILVVIIILINILSSKTPVNNKENNIGEISFQ